LRSAGSVVDSPVRQLCGCDFGSWWASWEFLCRVAVDAETARASTEAALACAR